MQVRVAGGVAVVADLAPPDLGGVVVCAVDWSGPVVLQFEHPGPKVSNV
ncbi:hypothetical protein [Amycolatopsis sp. PS_44_ISF1]|nr:hypothetical protein [Amycolatopsis sp. PS_44_ISF1]MDT8913697.1 hypothetical protein [Amycolatopsis sp. PS_44_ISF1]